MEWINVLFTRGSTVKALSDDSLRQITTLSPKIKLTYIGDLIAAEQRGDSAAKERLDKLLAEAEIIYGSMILLPLLPRMIAKAPKLRWIQAQHAGVEKFLIPEIVESPVILTSSTGMHATPIAEFVIGRMLMFAKLAPLCFRLQQDKLWKRISFPSVLASQTLGIIGLGSIGKELARLAKAFRMRVLATRRSAKQVGRARYVDTVLPPHEMARLLSESDFVALTLPFTHETERMIGREELWMMKLSAYLINVSRGNIVDEEALIQALQVNRISGAALDAFDTEPLPADSRLWELPNVILSPHISGTMSDYGEKATEIFVKNLKRYLEGKKLFNVVDKKRGY